MWIKKWINIMDKTTSARLLAEERFTSGWRPAKLLTGGNTKLEKSERTVGLSLAPANTSGYEVCASRSPECSKHCIHTSGMGSPNFHAPELPCNPVWVGRVIKTMWFFRERQSFMEKLYKDVANNRGASIRLNVFSDWIWERQMIEVSPELAARYGTLAGRFASVIDVFPDTQFYDYTKHAARMFRSRPKNYHLTFSLTENNSEQASRVLQAGMNVAAVVTRKEGYLFGYPVIDGDINDQRYLDPKASVVGLSPKGSLVTNQSSEFIYEPRIPREAQAAA